VLRLTASTLWTNLGGFFLLYVGNALLVVPVLALGLVLGLVPTIVLSSLVVYPTFVAIMGTVAGTLHESKGTLFDVYRETISATGVSAALIGVLVNTYLYTYIVSLSQLSSDQFTHNGLLITSIAQTLFLALLTFALIYALPLIALFHLDARTAFRNGLLLAASAPLSAIGMLSTLILLGTTVVVLGAGMLLIAPLAAAVMLVVNCHVQVQRVQSQKEPEL
jgi:uncharacterized membrane protein YesL